MATSKEDCSGGYVVDIANESDNKFVCSLCLCIVKKATHGCANHIFCFDCLQKYIESNDRKVIQYCPAGCRQTFNINKLSSNNPFIDRIINQIECKCSFCGWKGQLLDFVQVHEGKCEEKEVPCHLCSITLKRKYIDQHLKDECTHRPVVCRGCQKNFSFINHLKHEESCEDIKVECSFTNFGCNVQDTRRNMIAHENNSCQHHLCLIAKYFADENKQLKEETKQLKQENKQLKEETKQLEVENKKLKEKDELLETKIKVTDWKLVNIPQILLKEPVNKFFYFPAVDEMHIKNILLISDMDFMSSQYQLFDCFNQNNFTWIIRGLASKCEVLNKYKEELHKLFSSTKTIKFDIYEPYHLCYFFQIDNFKYYKHEDFSAKKDGNIFYIENYYNRDLRFYISKWEIKITKRTMQIDITKQDERFKQCISLFRSSKYFNFFVFY